MAANYQKLIEILKELGLSENEARVYFATLSLGPTTILKIAQTAEIKRTTIYSIVQSLKERGLISVEIKGFKKHYVAASPHKLESAVDARRQRFLNSLPEFEALYKLRGESSTIKYYEGLAGVKTVYEALLADVQPDEDYLVISMLDDWYKLDKDYFEDFVRRRAQLDIKIRILLQDSPLARENLKLAANYNAQIKILPKNTKLTTNLVVIPKKVVIHQLIAPINAIVIENKSVIQLHREMFEVIWNSISFS